jgi:hypothetical protein
MPDAPKVPVPQTSFGQDVLGWRDQQLPDGTVIWTSPTGQAYRTTPLVRLSAEVRHCEQIANDLVARINFGVDVAKSPQHQRAARERWRGRPGTACIPGR